MGRRSKPRAGAGAVLVGECTVVPVGVLLGYHGEENWVAVHDWTDQLLFDLMVREKACVAV